MNIVQLTESLKDLSKDQLVSEAKRPSGVAPPYLIIGELQRRKRMESALNASQNAQQPQTTVAQDVVNAAGVPQQGLAQMAQALAPKTDMAQNTARQPTTMMAGGTNKYTVGEKLSKDWNDFLSWLNPEYGPDIPAYMPPGLVPMQTRSELGPTDPNRRSDMTAVERRSAPLDAVKRMSRAYGGLQAVSPNVAPTMPAGIRSISEGVDPTEGSIKYRPDLLPADAYTASAAPDTMGLPSTKTNPFPYRAPTLPEGVPVATLGSSSPSLKNRGISVTGSRIGQNLFGAGDVSVEEPSLPPNAMEVMAQTDLGGNGPPTRKGYREGEQYTPSGEGWWAGSGWGKGEPGRSWGSWWGGAQDSPGATEAPADDGMDVNDQKTFMPPTPEVEKIASGSTGSSISASLSQMGQMAAGTDDKIMEEFTKDKWLALARAGAAIMMTPNVGMSAIGAGVMAGLEGLAMAKQNRDAALEAQNAQAMEQAKLALAQRAAAARGRGGGGGSGLEDVTIGDLNYWQSQVQLLENEMMRFPEDPNDIKDARTRMAYENTKTLLAAAQQTRNELEARRNLAQGVAPAWMRLPRDGENTPTFDVRG